MAKTDKKAPAAEKKPAAEPNPDAAAPAESNRAPEPSLDQAPKPEIASPAPAAAPAKLAAAVPAPKTVRAIHPNRHKLAETQRNLWCVYPDHGTPFEALLDPAYWANVARQMRITDRIEVYPEDSSYFAELIVRSLDRTSAAVGVLRKIDLGDVPVASQNEFRVDYAGPVLKHAVIRLRDRKVVQSGFDTAEAAYGWLGQNSKSLAA